MPREVVANVQLPLLGALWGLQTEPHDYAVRESLVEAVVSLVIVFRNVAYCTATSLAVFGPRMLA